MDEKKKKKKRKRKYESLQGKVFPSFIQSFFPVNIIIKLPRAALSTPAQ